LHDFHKIYRVSTSLHDALAVKISLDLLKDLWSYGGFKFTGLVTPELSAPPSGDYAPDPQKFPSYKNVLEILYHHARFGGAQILPTAGAAKTLSFLSVCLSVCLSVHHTFKRQSLCARFRDFAVKALEYRSTETILMPLDTGRFLVLQSCSTFSDCRQLSTPLNVEVHKTTKLGFFAARGRQRKPIQTKFGT